MDAHGARAKPSGKHMPARVGRLQHDAVRPRLAYAGEGLHIDHARRRGVRR